MPKPKEVLSSTSGSDSDSPSGESPRVSPKPRELPPPPPVSVTEAEALRAKVKEQSAQEKPAKKAESGETSKSSGGDDNMFQIGKMRYVSVRDFKGRVLVDIREYW